MAYLLLPLNGIGRGHLTRALIFAEWLRQAGRLPMIALQGTCRFSAAPSVPTTNIPSLHRMEPAEAQRIADDVTQVALMSGPAVLIEDTHPRKVRWPREIVHVIVMRPTHIDHMRLVNRLHGETGARLLVCDHPESPTWPYDPAETAEIVSWPSWVFLGPIFRTTTADDVERMRHKYRLQREEELFVFSMGGGGDRDGGSDRPQFIESAVAIASQLRERVRQPRFVFVRGPLFPPEMTLPEIFEDVHEEPELPSLFCLAKGAVVRPGYNVTWECIAAGVPFIALPGTTPHEPVHVRLQALAAQGIETSLNVERLLDPEARARFLAACSKVLERFDGSPRELFLAHTRTTSEPAMEEPAATGRAASGGSLSAERLEQLARAVREAGAPMPLRIRLDDVTRLDGGVRWLVSLCRELGAPLSLEIVPYHNAISGRELDRLDRDGIVDVSQHGYAHLPEYRDGGVARGEFIDRASEARARAQLRIGLQLLERAFGERFRGGYSAPYDIPPPWLVAAWRAAGGRYLSWMYYRPEGDELSCVRLGVDPWDWQTRQPRDAERLVGRIVSTMARDAGVGLVFHPQCLREQEHRETAEDLLRCLLGAGCVPTRIAPQSE